MSEIKVHQILVWTVIVVGAGVFVSLFFVAAPYGRHRRAGWGPTLSSRAGWIIMESPAMLGFAAIYSLGRHALEPVPLALAGLWLAHYVHRTVVYPLRLR